MTHPGLLASIVADPLDDAPRLIYADWCENNGEGERAEFIRCQCEIACLDADFETAGRQATIVPAVIGGQAGTVHYPMTVEELNFKAEIHERLRRRERELWHSYSREWFVDESIPMSAALDDFKGTAGGTLGIIRRGFVDEARLSTADWFAHGPALVRQQPITRVVLDRKPSASQQHPGMWRWYVDDVDAIPREIYILLKGEYPEADGMRSAQPYWRTSIDAREALSDAALAWARGPHEGLVALPEIELSGKAGELVTR